MGDGTGNISEPTADVPASLGEAEADLVRLALTGEEIDLKRRRVRATILRELLLETRPAWVLPPAGLRLSGAIIEGTLDLDGCHIVKPMLFRHCRFEATAGEPAIILRDARVKRLGIHSSTVEGDIQADRVEAENGFYFGGGAIIGVISMRGATIGGALSLENAEIGDGKLALLGTGLRLKGPLILRRSKISGAVSVPRAHLESGISGHGLRIAADGHALDAESARIGGDILLSEAVFKGGLSLANVRLEGRLTANCAVLDSVPLALDARGLDVSHGILLDNARLRGTANFEGANVGKTFSAESIEVDGGETAISADIIRIGGNWELRRAKLIGQLKFQGAKVEGQLRLTEARLFGHDIALRADGAQIRGGCFMSRATVLGLVRFPACEIGNQLRMRGATIKVEAGTALLASGTTFGRDVELTDGFETAGAIVLDQVHVAGVLDLRGSRLVSAAISRGGLPAPVPVNGSRSDEIALSLVDAHVNRLVMPSSAGDRSRGIVDLSRTRAGSFEDYADAWPPSLPQRARTKDGRDIDHMLLDGFEYDHLSNPAGLAPGNAQPDHSARSADRVAQRRIRWLDGQRQADVGDRLRPQAWVALSQRLAQQGYGDDAQRIDIARRRRERRSANVTTAARWQSRLVDWFALYGHNPWRTVVWMAAVVLLFAGIWAGAARWCQEPGCFDESVFVVRNKDAYREQNFRKTYPAFHALAYSFDVFVPFVAFGYEDHWRPNLEYGPLAELPLPFPSSTIQKPGVPIAKEATLSITIGGVLYVLMIVEAIVGLILTSLLVTGFTGLLKGRSD